MHRWPWALPVLAVALASSLIIPRLVAPSPAATPARPLPPASYGPAGGRFVVSFGARPQSQAVALVPPNGAALEHVTTDHRLYVAKLVPNAYETVQVDIYPQRLTRTGIAQDVYRYLLVGFHSTNWHGLPSWAMDEACRVGDSAETCPGAAGLHGRRRRGRRLLVTGAPGERKGGPALLGSFQPTALS